MVVVITDDVYEAGITLGGIVTYACIAGGAALHQRILNNAKTKRGSLTLAEKRIFKHFKSNDVDIFFHSSEGCIWMADDIRPEFERGCKQKGIEVEFAGEKFNSVVYHYDSRYGYPNEYLYFPQRARSQSD